MDGMVNATPATTLLRVLLAALLLGFPHGLRSQTAVQDTPVSTPVAARKGMFWKAVSGGNALYLLGSIHLGSKDMYPLPKEIEEAFESSAALIVEVDMKHVDMGKMQAAIMDKGMYKDDDTLWNHITPETKTKVETFCEKYGLPVLMAAKMKPWMLSMMAAILPMMKKGEMDPSLGIDMYFLDKQDKNKGRMRIVEIETAEGQIEMLSSLEGNAQDKQLASALQQTTGSDRIKEIQQIWLSGDADKLDEALSDLGGADVMKALITDRNKRMAEVAEQFLRGKERGFLVVGAAHMVGKEGIVRMLQKKGYQVEQVAFKK